MTDNLCSETSFDSNMYLFTGGIAVNVTVNNVLSINIPLLARQFSSEYSPHTPPHRPVNGPDTTGECENKVESSQRGAY